MKKVFTILGVIGILMSSCSKMEQKALPSNEGEGVHTKLTASIEETRTTIDKGWKTTWSSNDAMTVYVTRSATPDDTKPYGYSNFTYNAGTGKFEGTIDTAADPWNWFAVYPKTETSAGTTDELSVTITHPASQTMDGSSNAHIAENDPVFGYVLGEPEDVALVMQHAATVLDFNIRNNAVSAIKVTEIEFTAPGNIVGDFTATVDLKGASGTISPAWTEVSGKVGKTVTLSVNGGENIAAGSNAHFYAAVHPIVNQESGKYSIKVTATIFNGKETVTVTSTKDIDSKLTFKAGTRKPVNFTFTQATEEKTYTYVEPDGNGLVNVNPGTYLIGSYCDDGTSAGNKTYLCLFPPVGNNLCRDTLYSGTSRLTSITTSDPDIIVNEVVISGSSPDCKVYVKATGKYMYSADGNITFADTAEEAANQKIKKGSAPYWGLYTYYRPQGASVDDGRYFHHSTAGFSYSPTKAAQGYKNLVLFKLDEPAPIPEASFNIENPKLAEYLDAVEENPYFTSNIFGNYGTYYTSSLMKTNKYYSGNSSSNRLDQPAPVILVWDGAATKVLVYSNPSKSEESKVAEVSVNNTSYAMIYNLIPEQEYYYTATNGTTPVATGNFTPEGRRRMIKVSPTFNANNAANCRDLGGLPTVDGKHVKYGLIYRGTNIDRLSDDSYARDVFLNTMKIKWDIDLRASDQKSKAPDLPDVSKGTQSYKSEFNEEHLKNKEKVSVTLTEIMDAVINDEPVYIHCRIGADRTGYFCLLVEALIGVTQNCCDTDYEITSFASSVTDGGRFRAGSSSDGGRYKDGIEYFAGFSGTTLHDKVYNYVTSQDGLGIDSGKVDTFIGKMTE